MSWHDSTDGMDGEPAGDRVRVVLVGGDPLARGGLAGMLAGRSDVFVAGQLDPSETLEQLAPLRPQVLLWDLGPHARADFDQLRAMRAADLPVVALLGGEELASDVLAQGAVGLLLRTTDAHRLAAAIRAACHGLLVIDDAFASALLRARSALPDEPLESLTPREQEVLQLLSQGLPNKLIADRLHISEHTAKFHVNAIMVKLGSQGRTEAVVRAARLGLIML